MRLRDESSMWMRETDLTERAPRLLKEYMEKEEEREKDEKEEQQNKRGIKRSLEDVLLLFLHLLPPLLLFLLPLAPPSFPRSFSVSSICISLPSCVLFLLLLIPFRLLITLLLVRVECFRVSQEEEDWRERSDEGASLLCQWR